MQKKLNVCQPMINKQFKNKEEAYMYGKRLKEFIRATCKKKNWFAQAMISISCSNADMISDMSYSPSKGKVGRPRKERHLSDLGCKGEKLNKEWHLHLLLVSKPSSALMGEIKRYIERNWKTVAKIYDYEDFDSTKVKVYKKYCNIGVAEYMNKQAEEVLFCNDNYSGEEVVPSGYNLRKLYNEYLKVNKAKWYDDEYYNRNGRKKIMSKYNELLNYYRCITKEQDNMVNESHMKKVQYNKVQENYSRRKLVDLMFSGEY